MPNATPPPPELHLPDLPEVTVNLPALSLADTPQPGQSWTYRIQQTLSAYLPLLLLALLAGGTWWLVRHTPSTPDTSEQRPPRSDPDYTMNGFSLLRFASDGRLEVRISGETLRHFPDTDRMEIDDVRIHAIAPDGRVTEATARRALANGDASEVQLLGGAEVNSQMKDGQTLLVQSEFLQAFTRFERLKTHLPVVVTQGAGVVRAGGMDYEHPTGVMKLEGPVRATLPPRDPFGNAAAAAPRR